MRCALSHILPAVLHGFHPLVHPQTPDCKVVRLEDDDYISKTIFN